MQKFTLRHAIATGAMVLSLGLGSAPVLASSQGAVTHGRSIPVQSTTVRYIRVLVTLNIRSGPGYGYPVIERFFAGNKVPVTGLSMDSRWWRVPCPPGGTLGDCFVARNYYWNRPAPPYSPNEPFPVVNTSVKRVQALLNVNIRRGPDYGYARVGSLLNGATINVYGVSVDGNWYQVDCPPGGANGNCFMNDSLGFTRPVN